MAEVPTMEVYVRGSQPPATVIVNVEDYDPKLYRKMDEADEPASGPGRLAEKPVDKGPEPGVGPGKR